MIDLSLSENQNTDLVWLKSILSNYDIENIPIYNKGGQLKSMLSEIHKVTEDNIFLTYGAESSLEKIFIQIAFLCQKENYTLILPEIYWDFYMKLANHYKIPTDLFPFKKEQDDFIFDVDLLKNALKKHEKAIVLLNLPINPLGSNFSNEEIASAYNSLGSNQFLILDESYYGYTNNNEDYCALTKNMDKCLVIRTFSKYFGLAGLRIGYFVTGSKWQELVNFRHEYLGHNSISDHIACECLNNKKLFDAILQEIKFEREQLYKFFLEIDGFCPFKSEANFLLVKTDKHVEYSEYLISQGIKIRVLENKILTSHVRIGIGTAFQMKKLKESTMHYLGINSLVENNKVFI